MQPLTPQGTTQEPTGASVIGNPGYMVFDHYYRDPLHPLCQRRVQVMVHFGALWRMLVI